MSGDFRTQPVSFIKLLRLCIVRILLSLKVKAYFTFLVVQSNSRSLLKHYNWASS